MAMYGVAITSVLSKITFFIRKFLPICMHTACRAPPDIGVFLGTKSLTRLKKITTTKTQALPRRLHTGRGKAFEC